MKSTSGRLAAGLGAIALLVWAVLATMGTRGGTEPSHPERKNPGPRQSPRPIQRDGSETDSQDSPEHRAERARKEAFSQIELHGDYSQLARMLQGLDEGEKFLLMMDAASRVSPVGGGHDLLEKLKLAETVAVPESRSRLLRDAIIRCEVTEKYDSLVSSQLLEHFNSEDITTAFGTLAQGRVDKAFQRVTDLKDQDKRRIASRAVALQAIRADLMDAGKQIAALPAGIIRDEAAAELSIRLHQTKSHEDSSRWLDGIVDPASKARAEASMKSP